MGARPLFRFSPPPKNSEGKGKVVLGTAAMNNLEPFIMMVSSLDFRCWRRSPVAIYSSFIVLLLTNASVGGFQSQRSFVSPAPARTHLDSASQGGLESTQNLNVQQMPRQKK